MFKTSISEALKKKIKDEDYSDILFCLLNASRKSIQSDAHPKSYANVSNSYQIHTTILTKLTNYIKRRRMVINFRRMFDHLDSVSLLRFANPRQIFLIGNVKQ